MKRLMTLWLLLIAMAGYGQSADVKMKTYVDGLMKKMTLEEKIGQYCHRCRGEQ